MVVLRASLRRSWMGFLVQLVYISSVKIVQTMSAENGSTTHLTETRSIIATILESNQSYHTNQPDTSRERNTSRPCSQRFSNLRTNQTENDPGINSTFPSIQYRIKRCLPADLAKLKSKRLENRSKIQKQVEDWKNRRSARPSKARAFPKSASESQRENNAPSMIDKNKSSQNVEEVRSTSNFTSSNNYLGRESESNSSSTSNESNQAEKYGNKILLDNQSNMRQVTEKIFKDKYPIPKKSLEKSTTQQTGLTISSQTTSFESFDAVPIESKTSEFEKSNIPHTTTGFSNLLTDLSTSPMDTGYPREVNQNNSKTTSTEQPIEETILVPNFEEMHNSIESNSPIPDLDFPNTSQNLSRILNSRDQPKLSNNTSDSKGEWLPQNSKLESSNASCEFNFSENTHNLEQDTTTDIDIVFSTPFSQIPPEIDLPKISGDKHNSSDFLLPFTNENRKDTIKENTSLKNDSLYEEKWFTVPSSLLASENQKQPSITTEVEWPFTDGRESSSNSLRYDTLSDRNSLKIESLPTSTSLFLITNTTVQEMSTTEDSFSVDGATNPSVSSISSTEEYTPTYFYIPSENTDLSNNLEDITPTLSILTGDNESFREIQTPNLPISDNQPTSFKSSISSSVTPINEKYDPNQKYDLNEKTISYLKPEDLQEYSNAETEKLSFSNLAGFRNDQSNSPIDLSTVESQQHTLSTSMTTEIYQNEKYESTEKNQLTDHDVSFHGSNRENIFPPLITNNHHYIYSKKNSTVKNLPDLSNSESSNQRNRPQDSAQPRQMDSSRDENKIAPVSLLPMRNSHLAPSGGLSMIENITMSEINHSQEHGLSYSENLKRDETSRANPTGSSTFSMNSVTQLQNIFTTDPRGSDERENPLDLQINHPTLLKLESTPVFVPHNEDSNRYHLKEDYKHSRNHKNAFFSSVTETLPYPSFLRRHLHQPPESKDERPVTVEENLTSVTKPRGNREVIFHHSAPSAKFEHSDSSTKTDFLNMESASTGLEDKAGYQNRVPVNQTVFKANEELYDISEKNKAQSEYEKSSVLKMEKNCQKVPSLVESPQNSTSSSTSNRVRIRNDSTTGSQDAEFEKLIRPTFELNFGPSFVSSKIENISIPTLFRPKLVLQNSSTTQNLDSLQLNSTPDQFSSSPTSESLGISENSTPNSTVTNESVTRSLELTDFTQNLFESGTTESSGSSNPQAYKPLIKMELESFPTSDPGLKDNLPMTFALPANSVQESTNQNYLTPTTTPMAQSLEATEDNDILFESRNKGKFSLTFQQNADTSTEKLEKSQISGRNFDIINKSNERYNSTEQQTVEYSSVLPKLLQKENMRDNKSPQKDMKQNRFVTVTRNVPNQTGESEDKFTETMIEQTENSKNIEKMSNQMKRFEPEAIQNIADQTRSYKQTQIFSSYSPPQKTDSASFTNYGNNQPKVQISDSLSTPTNLLLTPEVTTPQQEMEIFTQVRGGLSKTENSVSNSTDRDYFLKEMENFSEDHSQMLVKKSFKHLPIVPNENSQFTTPVMVTNPPNSYITKKYKLRHFLNNSRENLFKRRHLGSTNSVSGDQKLSYIPTIAPTDSPREFDHSSITESLSTDSTIEFASEHWTSSEDLENQTKTRESLQDNNLPTILFQNNSDSYPQNLVNLNVMKKTHKIQPGEVVPPMNPNENWKIGENDTYYTMEELKSFFKMKKKNLTAEKGMNKYPLEIVIDLNGLNETTIIDFLKHNLTSAHQNETISFNTTKYKIFKLFSNSTDNFDRNELNNESRNSTLIYSLIPQEDLYQRGNSSEKASATSDQNFITSKYLAQLKENLFNGTEEDEKALKFFQELSSLNKIFSGPNSDFKQNEFNETTRNRNVSNSTDILADKCTGNTEVILVNLNDPQPEKELLEKLCSDCTKIVVMADNNRTQLKNAHHVSDKKNLAENIISSTEELSIFDKKYLVKGKSADDCEGKTIIIDRKNGVEGKSVSSSENVVNNVNEISSSRHHNFLPGSRHHFKTKFRDPEEQLIKKQFSFVNPQVVDNFLDVYKHYSPRHSAARSRMRQDRGNNARSSEDVDWVPRPHSSYRKKPTYNSMDNLLRELVRLRNSVPAAYVSHGYAN